MTYHRQPKRARTRTRTRTRTRRDGEVSPIGARTSEPRTLARYRREVVGLLMIGHGLSSQRAVTTIKKWDKYLQAKWRLGRPPCNVADHLSKFERVLKGRSLGNDPGRRDRPRTMKRPTKRNEGRGSRLVQGRRLLGTYPTRQKAIAAGRRYVRRTGRPVDVITPTPRGKRSVERWHTVRTSKASKTGKRRRNSRDAEHPKVGEIFETKAGQRWEVTEVSDKRVSVRRKGYRPRNEGPFVWGRTSLKNLKESRAAEKEANEAKETSPQMSLFSRGLGHERDPSRKRRPAAKAKRKAGRASLARKAKSKRTGKGRVYRPVHTCPRSTIVQTLVFSKKQWSVRTAKAWAKAHGYRYAKVDVTTGAIRLRQHPPSGYRIVGSKPFRKGLIAVLGCPKRGS